MNSEIVIWEEREFQMRNQKKKKPKPASLTQGNDEGMVKNY